MSVKVKLERMVILKMDLQVLVGQLYFLDFGFHYLD